MNATDLELALGKLKVLEVEVERKKGPSLPASHVQKFHQALQDLRDAGTLDMSAFRVSESALIKMPVTIGYRSKKISYASGRFCKRSDLLAKMKAAEMHVSAILVTTKNSQ